MEKTINITLGGLVFILEEDAYEKLSAYLESIKKHYQTPSEGEEIADDIESSIAEKFSARVDARKKVVTLKDVEEIIGIMGTIEEIAKEEEEIDGKKTDSRAEGDTEEPAKKRLYRNSDDIVVAGVCSGLAVYFGVDPIFVRLLFIIFTFFNGIGILVYVVLWMIMPVAKTGAQKLEMRGRPVNLAEIQEAVKQKSKMIGREGKEALKKIRSDKRWYQVLNFPIRVIERIFLVFKKIISVVFPVLSIFFGVVFLLATLAAILGLTIALGAMILHIGSPFIRSDVPLNELASDPFYYLATLSIYFTVFVPLVFLSFLSITMIRRKNAFAPIASGILVGIWMLSIVGSVVAAGDLVPRFKTWMEETAVRETETRSFDYRDFSKLYLGGNTKIKIRPGSDFSIVLTGRGSDLDRLEFEIEEGQLQVTEKSVRRGGFCVFCFEREISGEITMPSLESFVGINRAKADIAEFADNLYVSLGESAEAKIEPEGQSITGVLSGVSSRLELTGEVGALNIKMDGGARLETKDIKADRIEIAQSSWSRSEFSGKAAELKADLENGSRLSAFGLSADRTRARASDYSRAEVWGVSSLEIISRDQAEVIYRGQPETLIKKAEDASRIEEWEDNSDWPAEEEFETDAIPAEADKMVPPPAPDEPILSVTAR
ncbi:MAG: PspC domain-containing protein [Candidatus Falkowbacteria bacterium]